jgi:hypothetical protein
VQAFAAQVRSVATSTIASGAGGDAATAVRSAAGELEASFEQAMAPIDCS